MAPALLDADTLSAAFAKPAGHAAASPRSVHVDRPDEVEADDRQALERLRSWAARRIETADGGSPKGPFGTVGERLRRRRRRIMSVVWAGLALFVGGAILPAALGAGAWWPGWLSAVGLVGFAIAWLTMMGIFLSGIGFRCPACGANLTQLFLYGGSYAFGGVGSVRFCPRCGCDFDATVTDAAHRQSGPAST
jgi:hypothetical protein